MQLLKAFTQPFAIRICSNRIDSIFSHFLLIIVKEEMDVTMIFPIQMDYYTQ